MENQAPSKGVAMAVIALGVGIALLCDFGGIVTGRQIVENEIREETLANALPEQGMFAGYEQLSNPLCVLVNGEVPLPEDWEFLPFLVDDEVVDRRMARDLSDMVRAAAEDNVWLWVASGYRSRERQRWILETAIEENRQTGMGEKEAETEALKTIALPGHSEHETGLAVDFNQVSGDFANTEAYRWLREHGADYGFVQRYRAEKVSITGVEEESWHYRYVGKQAAQEMERLDLCLEEYVLYRKSIGEK